MLQSIMRYSDDAAGIEKTLRGLQGFVTIAVGLAQSQEDINFWLKLRAQFALGRRYFRLLKWHPCWQNALRAANSGNPDLGSLRRTLEVVKFTFLGMYFFLEMFTITNALGVTTYEWGPKVQMEANKCWFYSISVSIVLCLYNWLMPPASTKKNTAQGEEKTNEKKGKKANVVESTIAPSSRSWSLDPAIRTQLVIDISDLIVPGAAVGWIPVGPIVVGVASTISTLITGRQIWNRVQQKAVKAVEKQ
ncbi:Putative peroxisomal biogenesis factor 11 [Septoria linicola]|uniref:Peroxisomal biogenesis factor 11 n=1 Tax=Septoria linicola TaxID=215465 RepID=A0A9Q9B2R0_9PEZI|nr:putative peroxisomal biogenesis factor 11 [Septoria linicola]USW57115.1 Putative peroxisomal biogenesis factor 11 [Septoria linicola]